jgi:hypothetical protein
MYASQALLPARFAHVCMIECYHPREVRRPISRIKVVRSRPKREPGEDVSGLIDDPEGEIPHVAREPDGDAQRLG